MPKQPLRNLRPELFKDEQTTVDAFTCDNDDMSEVSHKKRG